MNQFGTLQKILLHAGQIQKPSIRESILRNTERLQIGYKLIKLDDRAMHPLDLCELAYSYDGAATHAVLRAVGLLP